MTSMVEQARTLPPEVVGMLAGACVILAALATTVQLGVRRRKAELGRVSHEIVDERTGLLPRTAIPVRLGAELGWGGAAGVPVSVVLLRIRGAGFLQATGVLRGAMRDEEQAFLLTDDKVVVELWD